MNLSKFLLVSFWKFDSIHWNLFSSHLIFVHSPCKFCSITALICEQSWVVCGTRAIVISAVFSATLLFFSAVFILSSAMWNFTWLVYRWDWALAPYLHPLGDFPSHVGWDDSCFIGYSLGVAHSLQRNRCGARKRTTTSFSKRTTDCWPRKLEFYRN